MKSKQGQVQTIAPAILALIFAAIILVFGLIITQSIRDVDVVRTSQPGLRVLETVTFAEREANSSVDAASSPGFGNFAVVEIRNDSASGQVINPGNYTVGFNYIANTSASTFPDDDWIANYTYTYGGEAFESANKTVVGLGTMSDFWEIIVLAIVITVVIGLLLVVFGGRRER